MQVIQMEVEMNAVGPRNYNQGNPSGWPIFLLHVAPSDVSKQESGDEGAEEVTVPRGGSGKYRSFYRFMGQYRTASRYQELVFCPEDGVEADPAGRSSKTTDGYSRMFGVALAYNSLESLGRARGDYVGEEDSVYIPVLAPDLASEFRDKEELAPLKQAMLDNLWTASRGELERFLAAEESSDVRVIAKGLRHLTFHGVVTPSTVALTKRPKAKARNEFLVRLREAVLWTADANFSSWVTEEHMRLNQAGARR